MAITRKVGPRFDQCELTHVARQAINLEKARAQHLAYEQCLSDLGLRVISLPEDHDLPDSVFVEDAAILLDEVAVICRPGAASRRAEVESVAAALQPFRRLQFIAAPATLEGGDVLIIDRTAFVGLSQRTNLEGVTELGRILLPLGYEVRPVQISGCLHLKTGCTYLGYKTVLLNPSWIDVKAFEGFDILAVGTRESADANTLAIGDQLLVSASFPSTRRLIEQRGFAVKTLDISELQKAEAGLTCMSLIFANCISPFVAVAASKQADQSAYRSPR